MACCVMFIINEYFSHQLHQQMKKNQELKFNLTQARHAQREADASTRAPNKAHFLRSLDGWIPTGIHLKRVEELDDDIVLWGVAESAHAIDQLMYTIKQTGAKTQQPLMTEPTKHVFSLRVQIREAKSG